MTDSNSGSKASTIGIGGLLLGLGVALVGVLLADKSGAAGQGAAGQGAAGQDGAAQGNDGQARTLGGANPATMPGGRAAQPTTEPTTVPPQPLTPGEGHAAPDLAAGADLGPNHRAPEAFRPDIDAPMTPAEREALRPPVGAPSLSGVSTSQPSGG